MSINKSTLHKHYIGFQTIIIYEVLRFTRIWAQTILPPVVTITLYFIIFGAFIGSQIGDIKGVTFMQYITPGLIMMSIITNAYSNVVSSFYSMRFQRSVEEILIAPIPHYLILLGFSFGGVLRGVLVGILVTFVALLFTHLTIQHVFITFFVTFLTAFLFSLAGFTNALLARSFDDISIVPTFVLTPLIYLGGVFYSISQLPTVWQHVSRLNPILYIINAFRYGILGITDIDTGLAIVIIMFAIIILFFLNLRLLNKGVGIRT